MSVTVHSPYGAQIRLRPVRSEDVPLVTNSWLRSFRDSCHVWGVPDQSYFWCHHKILEKLIPRSSVVVACLEDDPNVILGWIAYEMAGEVMVLHNCYVKKPFRGLHIASRLFKEVYEIEGEPTAVIFTARTKHSWSLYEKKLKASEKPLWVYNPYLMYNEFNDWAIDPNDMRRFRTEDDE